MSKWTLVAILIVIILCLAAETTESVAQIITDQIKQSPTRLRYDPSKKAWTVPVYAFPQEPMTWGNIPVFKPDEELFISGTYHVSFTMPHSLLWAKNCTN